MLLCLLCLLSPSLKSTTLSLPNPPSLPVPSSPPTSDPIPLHRMGQATYKTVQPVTTREILLFKKLLKYSPPKSQQSCCYVIISFKVISYLIAVLHNFW